jgi:hypothetical protein
MATASKKPAAKKPGTAVAKWDEALAARAQAAKKTEESVGTGSFLSTKGGILAYMGNPVPGNKLNVIILDAIMENQFYEGDYDPNNPQSPVCYAFGRDEDEIAPHEKVEAPQADQCKGCPNNEWGSAEKGRGKACKNIRRLGMITEDMLDGGAEAIEDAETAFMKLPVTSVKAWAGYVNQLAATNKPPLAFVTEISVVPDANSQFKVQFKVIEEIDDGELLGALLHKADVVEELIAFPYQAIEAAPAKPQRAPARRAAAPAPVAKRAVAKPAAKPAAAPRRAAAAAAEPTAPRTSTRRKF